MNRPVFGLNFRIWEPAHDAELTRLWADPSLTVDQVGERLGRSRDATRARASGLGLPAKIPPRRRTAWDEPGMIERLTIMFRDGASFSAIASDLGHGLSRTACMAKANRLGLKRSADVWKPNVAAAQKLATAASTKARAARRLEAPKARPAAGYNPLGGKIGQLLEGGETPQHPPRVIVKTRAWDALPESTPRPFMDRPTGGCAWPINAAGGELLACCRARLEGSSWCLEHHRLGHAPADESKRDLRWKLKGIAA